MDKMTANQVPAVHLHQIAYSPATLAGIKPGYAVLDNLENLQPDWFEYWPIRRYLLSQSLDEAAFYRFFSPKFGHKTHLSHAEVVQFVEKAAPRADVVLFSPQPDMGAFFLNVFEQGETFYAGLIDAYSTFLDSIGRPAPLRQLVMDSRQVCFSNYFVARPAFWREWLVLNEALFEVCEGPGCALKTAFGEDSNYKANAAIPRKVFLIERAASLLLITQPKWRSVAHNPFGFNWSKSGPNQHVTDAYISDALKVAFKETRRQQYLEAFSVVRERVLRGIAAATKATAAPQAMLPPRHKSKNHKSRKKK